MFWFYYVSIPLGINERCHAGAFIHILLTRKALKNVLQNGFTYVMFLRNLAPKWTWTYCNKLK
jgi:hypothetical protein